MKKNNLKLSGIPKEIKQDAMKSFNNGNLINFIEDIRLGHNEHSIELFDFINANIVLFKKEGLFEPLLILAYSIFNASVEKNNLIELFEISDKKRLRENGDKIPSRKLFTLYRGIYQGGIVKGLSWTDKKDHAGYFAKIKSNNFKSNPEVYFIKVRNEDIFYFINRKISFEREFVINITNNLKPKLVTNSSIEIEKLEKQFKARIERETIQKK